MLVYLSKIILPQHGIGQSNSSKMELSSNSCGTALVLVLVFSLVGLTHQYVYSCNATAACGCSNNPASMTRIVGGETAGESTWGWAVSIFVGDGSLCGGSILSSTWIISAAHCFVDVNASDIYVFTGSNALWSGESSNVSSIIIHPNYNSETNENDIALLQLESPLDMSDPNVKIICMPSVSPAVLAAGEWPPVGAYVAAVGWGALNESADTVPDDLQQVTLQTIDDRDPSCTSVLNNRANQFCAGVNGNGKDTCQGDSGGPLMMFTSSHQWVLVGLTSYGNGCARPGYAGIYTRVAHYQTWINATTNGTFHNAASSNSANVDPFTTTTTSTSSTSATTTTRSSASSSALGTTQTCAIVFLLRFARSHSF